MMQSHRISTNIGQDQLVTVELKQDYDLLEILSLKFSQQDVYTSLCSDYGVVCGRISVNNGLGIPNARVSIFVPLKDVHVNDPVISALYPYTSITEKDENGYRYNLLPARQQHSGQEPTGTFPDQRDILTREEYMEVYENYYSYTVKTNNAGDFMIWGVPLGQQTIHVDVDLSDIGCFSLRPDDFIRQGKGVDNFKNSYKFKASNDLNSLPQIVSFDKMIEVYPFWGNVELCDIGITRTDFDLSDKGVKIEPKAYLLGSVFTDQGNNAVNKNCTPHNKMGEKCSLISEPAQIEIIRFTTKKDINHKPILEEYELHEDIGDDGAFVLPIPMNMDYVYTDEFGDNVITNDPNKGVPTSGCYRFRVSLKNTNLGRTRMVGHYLMPNIREYATESDKSYAWSLDWNDYPVEATSDGTVIFNNVYGEYYPQDYFFRFTYNKVYGASSFMGSYFTESGIGRGTFVGIKNISPKDEEDCENSVVTPPINWGIQKFNFSILLAIIINVFERLIYYAFVAAIQVLILPFEALYKFRIYINYGIGTFDWRPFQSFDKDVIEPLQNFGTVNLGVAIYPECETCDSLDYTSGTGNTLPSTSTDPATLYESVASGNAVPDSFMSTFGCSGYVDRNTTLTSYYFYIPANACSDTKQPTISDTGTTLNNILTGTTYIVKFTNGNPTQNYTNLHLNTEIISGQTVYYFDDSQDISYSDGVTPPTGLQSYIIYDTNKPLSINNSTYLHVDLGGGCQNYNQVYQSSIVQKTYCVSDPNTPYSGITVNDEVNGISCTGGKYRGGQIIYNSLGNECSTCRTHSGYSEFRNGHFTIVPAADTKNWPSNFDAITEYANRKLVGKLFCEGLVNYSFIDNWLTGALYFFPFKQKRNTKYCHDLVRYVSAQDKFYYRSSYTNGGDNFLIENGTLGHPTTFVDLGPRDEFIKEICVDPNLDPNCSVVRNIGPSTFKNHKEMIGLYINYRLETIGAGGTYTDFFLNGGFDSQLPSKMTGHIMNGDILQLISINNEAGIEGFDLQNRDYEVYDPEVLSNEDYPSLLNGGPLPINMLLDSQDGYRVRVCLNEPGRLGSDSPSTYSSQKIPFFLWNKGGTGFGTGLNQSWDYSTPISETNGNLQHLQGMTYGYAYSGETAYKYVLFPMTQDYPGELIEYSGITEEYTFDVIDVVDNHDNPDYTYNLEHEGFTYLYVTSGDITTPLTGILYTRVGEIGGWNVKSWEHNISFIIKPTTNNYLYNKQILSTPFLFYFGLRPGKTAVDKFIERFGPLNAFPAPIE